jgi:tetratricopeptide (TPR) repeat protein
MSRPKTLTNATLASQAALGAWRWIIGAVGANWRPRPKCASDPELRYLQTIARLRADPAEASERRLADLLEAHPAFLPALEEHAKVLDRLGRRDAAVARYESARRGRQLIRRGMPDRPFFTRHRGTSAAEIDGYTTVLRARAANKGAFIHVARGHAYLATGRARLALLDYDEALRRAPDDSGLLIARGEALRALGRHREALQALDRAVGQRPLDPEARSSRAVVLLALGHLAEADADWSRQLELLPKGQHEARACVALRLADHDLALNELERAIERNLDDPYLQLYLLTALRRSGRNRQPSFTGAEIWPGPLIAFQNGQLSAEEALKRADNPQRRAEALFQLGAWREAAELAAPDTIEHAAARHEIERLRAVTQPVSRERATERETPILAMSK